MDTFRVELVDHRIYSLGKCRPTVFPSPFFQNTLFNALVNAHSSLWEFPQLHWPRIGILSLFSISHSSGCLVVSHCGFNVHFPGKRLERALLQLLAIGMFSFVKCPFKSLVSISLTGLSVFFLMSFRSSLGSNYWFSDFSLHQNHPFGLKTRIIDPHHQSF